MVTKVVKVLGANQFVIVANGNTYFQSYDTIIAKINDDMDVIIDEDNWNCSVTTSKYLYRFLREYAGLDINGKKDVQKAILGFEITPLNLN